MGISSYLVKKKYFNFLFSKNIVNEASKCKYINYQQYESTKLNLVQLF